MYDLVGKELVDACVAKHREEAVWMDIDDKVVEESEAYGCKVNLDITDPDWVLVVDEVGMITHQKGDGNVGGELKM